MNLEELVIGGFISVIVGVLVYLAKLLIDAVRGWAHRLLVALEVTIPDRLDEADAWREKVDHELRAADEWRSKLDAAVNEELKARLVAVEAGQDAIRTEIADHMATEEEQRAELIAAIREGQPVGRAEP